MSDEEKWIDTKIVLALLYATLLKRKNRAINHIKRSLSSIHCFINNKKGTEPKTHLVSGSSLAITSSLSNRFFKLLHNSTFVFSLWQRPVRDSQQITMLLISQNKRSASKVDILLHCGTDLYAGFLCCFSVERIRMGHFDKVCLVI